MLSLVSRYPCPQCKKKALKVTQEETQQTSHVPKFVVFQAIICEKLEEMSDIEADTVETLIEDCYVASIENWESLWIPVVKGKGQELQTEKLSEVKLENKFYQRYVLTLNSTRSTSHIFYSNIDRLRHTVQVAIEEIYCSTTHKSSVICGGPAPGSGTLNSIMYVCPHKLLMWLVLIQAPDQCDHQRRQRFHLVPGPYVW